MRIRRRPLLLSLSSYHVSSLNPDPCLQYPQVEEERVVDGEERRIQVGKMLHPDVDLTSEALDSQVTSDNSGSSGAKIRLVGLGWCNGESEVFDNVDGMEENTMAKGKPMCSSNTGLDNDTNCVDGVVVVIRKNGIGKQRKSTPVVLMEGSRCSRVNGRGWRCSSQQTLVGYSLCEHHLGKGRLRCMSSARRGQSSTAIRKQKKVDEKEIQYNDGEKKNCKKKIRTMKARSISSLRDETDYLAAATLSSLSVSGFDSGKMLV